MASDGSRLPAKFRRLTVLIRWADHHTPGYASKLGSQDRKGGSENQGVGGAKFPENIGDQRLEV
jgi:hypothetical protein